MSLQTRIMPILFPVAGVLAGALGALLMWGHSSPGKVQLTQELKTFQNLPSEQQNTIRKSYALLKSLPEPRQAEIAKIFEQTQQNPELKKTVDRFSSWWSSLSQDEWDNYLELNTDQRIDFVKSRRASVSSSGKEIAVDFPGPESVRMPTLHLSFEEFHAIISAAIPESARPDALTQDLESLSSGKHQALRLTLSLFESFQDENKRRELDSQSEQFRAAMLENIQDEAWRSKFRVMTLEMDRKPFARPWMFMTLFTILDKATLALGEDLRKEFPVTSEQIVDSFASLQDKSDEEKALQRSLMTMSAGEARKKLELIAQSAGSKTPEEQLLARYNRFTQKRTTYLRGPFGFGGSGSGRPPRPPEDARHQREQPRRRPEE